MRYPNLEEVAAELETRANGYWDRSIYLYYRPSTPDFPGEFRFAEQDERPEGWELVTGQRVNPMWGNFKIYPLIKNLPLLPNGEQFRNGLPPDTYSAMVCKQCRDYFAQDRIKPPHYAARMCESGHRDHCTCDVCF